MTQTPTAPAIDFSAFDPDVRPQDDLFRHVNGRWLREVEIPEDKPRTGAFMELRDAAEIAVRDIITGLDDPRRRTDDGADSGQDAEEAKVADLYASFMDADTIERAGAEPLTRPMGRIDTIGSPEDLMRLLGGFARRGVAGLVAFDAESDPGDPTRYVIHVAQSGLGLPDEEYYRLDSYAEIRDAYVEHVSTMLGLVGIDDAASEAQRVLDLETEIAATHWDKVRCRDRRATYNLMTLQDFESASPGLHWRQFLAGAEVGESAMAELNVYQPSFFVDVAGLLTRDRLPDWRLWAKWRLISSMAPYLSSAFVDERFRFYGTVLSGIPVLKERWKRGVDLVEGALGEAVGKIYVQRHFSSVAKDRMDRLVANLIDAYRESIIGLDWMTEETKERALDKLANFRPHIGYPSKWRDYSALEIDRSDLIGNVMRVSAFELNRALAKIGEPIDREEWFLTPQTVNAYYHPLRNEIVFPAAILQPPFFNQAADDAVNYGAIGAVIGHEIGHGFDDQGSTFDGDGRLHDWWTAKDREAFEQRTAALISQYNSLELEQAPGRTVNGALTIGENIGDLGGLSIACKAYRIAQGDARPEPIDGYTDDQRLFLAWAAIWRMKSRTELVLQQLAIDPHAPSEFRTNQIVRNLPEFYEAFDVTESDALWMEETLRVKIW
ncbi:MAG TPA: M13-type metalloendopeptidase [Propionibacteriaceae bacterium]|nr:M13-type metalloendopeptidase [Propionibacteriaceae bacterium]